ncbi:unnamed protein product, partial [Brassica rapa subsp. narinosa]
SFLPLATLRTVSSPARESSNPHRHCRLRLANHCLRLGNHRLRLGNHLLRLGNHLLRLANHLLCLANHLLRLANHLLRLANHLLRLSNHQRHTSSANKMRDSVPLKLALPELKYPIGSQPKEKSAINQYSGSEYISIVDSILKPDEMIRVRGSFMGPIMKLSERGLKLSAKIVYAILTRSIVSVKENEAWFHFGAQPMSDVVDQLRNTREDASEERVCLAMLILVESILLRKSKGGSFPLEYAKNAHDMTYPWGKEAYIVLLKSIQNAVANHLENKSKFELQGYPLVFLLWILESIPLLRNKFSKWVPTVEVSGPTYLCEKYTEVENPSLDRVLQVEVDTKLKVHCILPAIPHDPEDDISIEDKYSDELETVKDVTKKGYKFTADDWENRCVDTFDTLDALIQMMANKETGQASPPIDEDSVNEKVNRIIEVMEENLKSMKDRMSLLEEENMHLRARVSELEGNNNVFPTNVTQHVNSQNIIFYICIFKYFLKDLVHILECLPNI